MATITNYPDRKTVAYAEVWSIDEFRLERNPYWWPRDRALDAEEKGDELGIGARWKLDIPAACWLVWEGTADGVRILQNEVAISEDELDNPPGNDFMPVYPNVNLIRFEPAPAPAPEPDPGPQPPGEEPGPEPPAPEPGPTPLPPAEPPRSFTIYGGGLGNNRRPVATWWNGHLIFSVPRSWFDEAWAAGPMKLLERMGEGLERE